MYKRYIKPHETEKWELIPNSKGYCVSNFGNIKRLRHKVWNVNNNSWNIIPERYIVGSCNNSKGYERVTIFYKNGGKITESVHRLVAKAFIVNPNIYKFNQVNHLDGNKLNNHWKNLQWCTNQMNMDHSWKVLKNRKTGGESKLGILNRKLTEDQVLAIPALLKTKTITEIADLYKVGVTTISEIVHGRSWSWLNLKFY